MPGPHRLLIEPAFVCEHIHRALQPLHLLRQGLLLPLEQLEAYAKTDEYAQADMDERQKVVDLIQELRQYVGADQSATWQELAKAIEAM